MPGEIMACREKKAQYRQYQPEYGRNDMLTSTCRKSWAHWLSSYDLLQRNLWNWKSRTTGRRTEGIQKTSRSVRCAH